MTPPTSSWRSVLAVVTFGVAAGWAVLGWLLLTDYRPGSGPATAVYQVLGLLLGVAALAMVVLDRTRLDVVPIAGLGAVAAIAAVVTLPQVLWDSLALTSVAVGDDVRGVWWPVEHADQIRFAVVSGRQVEPDAYRAALYAHVVAAAAALMTIPLAAWLGLRSAPARVDEDG